MTDTTNRSRQPAGVKTGGQFATESKPETAATINAPSGGNRRELDLDWAMEAYDNARYEARQQARVTMNAALILACAQARKAVPDATGLVVDGVSAGRHISGIRRADGTVETIFTREGRLLDSEVVGQVETLLGDGNGHYRLQYLPDGNTVLPLNARMRADCTDIMESAASDYHEDEEIASRLHEIDPSILGFNLDDQGRVEHVSATATCDGTAFHGRTEEQLTHEVQQIVDDFPANTQAGIHWSITDGDIPGRRFFPATVRDLG